ncbi:hypothetical protein Cpir12675_005822 [Ceratocystis pirilliformis]|uniref:Vacuolar calcium ion transporter n=1 Tax=Ceratocystis pirilliformis TaxID=259994 RepID=A0ABR3YM00_9PEZI
MSRSRSHSRSHARYSEASTPEDLSPRIPHASGHAASPHYYHQPPAVQDEDSPYVPSANPNSQFPPSSRRRSSSRDRGRRSTSRQHSSRGSSAEHRQYAQHPQPISTTNNSDIERTASAPRVNDHYVAHDLPQPLHHRPQSARPTSTGLQSTREPQNLPRRKAVYNVARETSRSSQPGLAQQQSVPQSTMSGNPDSWIRRAGQSGRQGFHPAKFLLIVMQSTSRASMLCNFLWPVVPVALAIKYSLPDDHLLIFALSYIAMIPCANTVGFAGTEIARKLPHVFGVLIEVTFGSVVEIILFMVLLHNDKFSVIKAALLGSILATMLLCLGMCFIAGGIRREEQGFSDVVSEVGSGLLLTAGVSLSVPSIFIHSLKGDVETEDLERRTLETSRAVSLFLMLAYTVYAYFQARTHHGIFDAIFQDDEKLNEDYHVDKRKPRLTLTEAVVALSISLALVTLIAISLVNEIEPIVARHNISDPFMGLIMVPLVEKFAEHLGAINEAWDNQMNLALSHVLGATIQTALFNGPLAVIVAWCLQKKMDLTFVVFDMAMLLLAIITVGGFLRDQKSNYLEGFLCVTLYLSIAVAAFFFPNLHDPDSGATDSGGH